VHVDWLPWLKSQRLRPVNPSCIHSEPPPHPRRPAISSSNAPVKSDALADYLIGDAKVDVTKDATVLRLAMAQHGSVLIELPANDGRATSFPAIPKWTVDEKALERNKRAIVVRPGILVCAPLPNRKARTPAATVTAQMRSRPCGHFSFLSRRDSRRTFIAAY